MSRVEGVNELTTEMRIPSSWIRGLVVDPNSVRYLFVICAFSLAETENFGRAFLLARALNRRARTLLTLLLQDAAKPRFYATRIAVASTGSQLEAGTHFYTLPSVKVRTDPRLCGKTAPPNAGLPLLLQSAVTLPRP